MSFLPENSIALRAPRVGKPEEGLPLPPKELQERIQALNKEMQDREGELVLVAVRNWERLVFDMPEERTLYGLDVNYYLGVIAPPYLKVENYRIVVGIKENVRFNVRRPDLEIKKEEGPIDDLQAWKINLDRDSRMEPDSLEMGKGKKLLEIIVGDENVAEWIEREVAEGIMPSDILVLKEKKPELFEREKAGYFDANLLNDFQMMYQALGRALPLSS